jgi:hypothetical protein
LITNNFRRAAASLGARDPHWAWRTGQITRQVQIFFEIFEISSRISPRFVIPPPDTGFMTTTTAIRRNQPTLISVSPDPSSFLRLDQTTRSLGLQGVAAARAALQAAPPLPAPKSSLEDRTAA